MKQTIVLVHGAWMDASAWYKVLPLLEQKGYEVIAVNLRVMAQTLLVMPT